MLVGSQRYADFLTVLSHKGTEMIINEKLIRLVTRLHSEFFAFLPSGILCALAIIIFSRTMLLYTGEAKINASGACQVSPKWRMNEGAVITPSQAPRRISPADQYSITVAQTKGEARATENQISTARQGKAEYLALNAEFVTVASRERFRVRDARVFNSYGRFADLFVQVGPETKGVLKAVYKTPGLRRIEPAAKVIVPPAPVGEPPRQRGRQPAEKIVRGGISGLTGNGVIIAIIDSGLDFRNPDFITYDAAGQPTSRLLYLWDTTSNDYDAKKLGGKPPLAYPNGASVGTLYMRDQLTAELRSATPSIPATDLNGHGTACAGIAAGNGNNGLGKEYVKGVAPEADIIAVR